MILKKAKMTCIMAMLLTSSVLAGQPSAPSDSLSVHIRLAKSVFFVGEEDPLDVYLVNQTGRALQVPRGWWLHRHLRLECRDSEGRLIPPSVTVSENVAQPEPTQSMPSGDSLLHPANLASGFGKNLTDSGVLRGQTAGTYAVRAFYEGEYASRELSYRVVEPTGSEKDVFEELRRIYERYGSQQLISAVPVLQELLRVHPRSVYAPEILTMLRNAYQTGTSKNDQKVVEYGKQLVQDFPNSLKALDALFDLAHYLPADSAKSYFTLIEGAKAGTRTALQARALRIYIQNTGSYHNFQR